MEFFNECNTTPLSDESNPSNEKALIEQWKRMLDFAENNSERRIKTNNVYLSINTLLLGGCTYVSGFQNQLLAISGFFISILWFVSIATYRTTNKVRYEIIRNLENDLKYKPISDEYNRHKKNIIYYGNTCIEMLIPIVFFVLFLICWLYSPDATP